MSEAVQTILQRAFQARREDRQQDAKAMLLEALDRCRTAESPIDLARMLTALGQIERDLKNTPAALQHYGEAVSLYREQGDVLPLAHSIRHIADIYQDQAQPEAAEPLYVEALELYRKHEGTPPLDLANAIRGLALLKGDRGLWEEARALYVQAGIAQAVAECDRRLSNF